MTITFKQYANAERPNLKPAKGLVMGWMVPDLISEREYLYAVFEDGRIVRCDAKLGTTNFDTAQRTWWPVTAVPDCAEWIGHYPLPRRVAQETAPSSTFVASPFSYDRN